MWKQARSIKERIAKGGKVSMKELDPELKEFVVSSSTSCQ